MRKIDRDLADAPSLLEAVAGAAASGRTAHVVYGSGNRHGRLQRVLADADYRVIDVPGQREQLRMRLALDALDAARSPDPPGTLVLAADDLELGDLLRRLRGSGPKVIVVGRRHGAILEVTDRLVDAEELDALLPRSHQSAPAERGAWESEPFDEADEADEGDDEAVGHRPGFQLLDEDRFEEDEPIALAGALEEEEEEEEEDEYDDDAGDDGFDEDDDERLELANGDASAGRYLDDSSDDLQLGVEDEDSGGLDFDEADDEPAPSDGVERFERGTAGSFDEASQERPGGRRRRRSRGGRRRGRGGASRGHVEGGGEGSLESRPEPRPVAARENAAAAPLASRGAARGAELAAAARVPGGDPIGLLREALDRIIQGSPRLVWGTVVLETMQELDPSFHGGEPAFATFDLLLEEAQRRGLVKLERSPATDSYLITALANG